MQHGQVMDLVLEQWSAGARGTCNIRPLATPGPVSCGPLSARSGTLVGFEGFQQTFIFHIPIGPARNILCGYSSEKTFKTYQRPLLQER